MSGHLVVPVWAALTACLLAGCLDSTVCPEGTAFVVGAGCIGARDLGTGLDAGPVDGGPDAGSDAGDEPSDAGLDGGPDFGPDLGPCGICADPMPFCDVASGNCVACLGDLDCPDAGAPVCADGACRGCALNDECGRSRAATPFCEATGGTCVECLPIDVDNDARCAGGEACIPGPYTCTGVQRNSLDFCEECQTDNECGADPDGARRDCVETELGDPPVSAGRRCLVDLVNLRALTTPGQICDRQQAVEKVAVSSRGVRTTYCFPREAVTSCSAILAFGSTCFGAAFCGGIDGEGLCQSSRCTYRCETSQDCPSPFSCPFDPGNPQFCTN